MIIAVHVENPRNSIPLFIMVLLSCTVLTIMTRILYYNSDVRLVDIGTCIFIVLELNNNKYSSSFLNLYLHILSLLAVSSDDLYILFSM